MNEIVGTIAALLAITGVVLNNRKLLACFPIWLVSNGLSCGLHIHAGLMSLAARDLVFMALAVEGWLRWRRPKS